MKKILLVVFLLFSTSAVADDYLIVNGISKHVGATSNYNEINPGLGYAWDTKWNWVGEVQPQIGFYQNSQSDWTVYAAVGKSFWTTSDKQWGVGGMVGAALGYEHTPVMPMAALVGTWRHHSGYGLNLLVSAYTDSPDHKDGSVKPLLGLQLVIPLKGK